jgi:hypothetical protein
LKPGHLLKPLTVDPAPVFGRFDVPELSFDEAFTYPKKLDAQQSQQPRRRRSPDQPIAYVDAITRNCPLSSHGEGDRLSDEEEKNKE